MTFQAYLDNIKTRTGKTPDYFRTLAAQKGLSNYNEVVAWLIVDFGMGKGHANAMAKLLVSADKINTSPEENLRLLFAGDKARWRIAYDRLTAGICNFGADIIIAPTKTYIKVQRGSKKFAVLQPSTAGRFDIGIKLKGVAPTGRLEVTRLWAHMATHRVRISDPLQMDDEVLEWLKQAYQAA